MYYFLNLFMLHTFTMFLSCPFCLMIVYSHCGINTIDRTYWQDEILNFLRKIFFGQ